jgi:hypothetical protein
MSSPTLTPDGRMSWRPRDWLESLCVEQPDGTWLIQAPLSAGEDPLLYLLPDAAAKDRFVKQATGLVWQRVALKHWTAPLSIFLPIWMPLVGTVTSGYLGPLVLLAGLAIIGVAVGVHVLRERLLFTWLAEASVKPPDGWKRPEVLVRRWEEWEGLYLSLGLPGQWGIGRVMAWITVMLSAVAAAFYLNLCQGIGILDLLIHDRDVYGAREVLPRCDAVSGGFVPFGVAVALAAVYWNGRLDRRQRAGLARPVPAERIVVEPH